MQFDVWPGAGRHHLINVVNVLRTNTWFHVAAVTGRAGMQVYVNGVLAGTDTFDGSFASVGSGEHVRLGRDNWDGSTYARAQFDEVRVWSIACTRAEIQARMFQSLTGREAHLAGLWNFGDGSPKDASPEGHDWERRGSARIVGAPLPDRDQVEQPAIVQLALTHPGGNPVRNAEIRLEQAKGVVAISRQIKGGQSSGRYSLAVYSPQGAYDLSASDGNSGEYKAGVPLRAGESQQVELVLKDELSMAGRVLGLDGKTPLASLLVQVVRPVDTNTGLAALSRLRLNRADNRPVIDSALTDRAGEFKFFNLRPGVYSSRNLTSPVWSGRWRPPSNRWSLRKATSWTCTVRPT